MVESYHFKLKAPQNDYLELLLKQKKEANKVMEEFTNEQLQEKALKEQEKFCKQAEKK